jgi:hypothetical protein
MSTDLEFEVLYICCGIYFQVNLQLSYPVSVK